MNFFKNNIQFFEKQNYDVYLGRLITACSHIMRAYAQSACVCVVYVFISILRSLFLKRKNEYLSYVKETAKTPLSIALCGQLRGMLSLTSYCSYIVYSQRAFIVFFRCIYIVAGTWIFGVLCIYHRYTRKFNPKTYMFIFYCSKDKLCPNQHTL